MVKGMGLRFGTIISLLCRRLFARLTDESPLETLEVLSCEFMRDSV